MHAGGSESEHGASGARWPDVQAGNTDGPEPGLLIAWYTRTRLDRCVLEQCGIDKSSVQIILVI